MEDILEVYQRPYDSSCPVVCMDEMSKQLLEETRIPLPVSLGNPQKYDYEYERKGVNNVFMVFEPLDGQRHVSVTDRRTKVDWANCVKDIVDLHYSEAAKITLVMDNLNTHKPSSLYEAFPPEEARRLLNKLEFHYTPKHGSWLNMAELEISVFSRQCWDRRLGDLETLRIQTQALEDQRNAAHATVKWHFTCQDARQRMRRVYPSVSS